MKQELKAIPLGNGKFRIQQPCKFFTGKSCEIFEVKPFTCLSYPTIEILKNLSTGIYDDFCPIIDDILSELVIKRVIEEKLFKENPKEFNEITEKWNKEILSYSELSQKERLEIMILKYNNN